MCTRGLPDIYTLSPRARALGVYIRQTTRAHGITIKCIYIYIYIYILTVSRCIYLCIHLGMRLMYGKLQRPMKALEELEVTMLHMLKLVRT